jgi:PAS domain S-box-containing protein
MERFMSKEGDGAEENAESAAQLQATLNVIPAYTWYTAPSGTLTFVNKRTADYLGLPEDHPLRFGIDIGAPWDAHIPLLHPDDREESREAWAACLRMGEAAEFTQRVRDPQGDYRWFLSRAEPLRARDGTILQWVGVNLDIEELKKAEDRLRRSEAYLAEAQRLSHTGSAVYNKTEISYLSDEAARMFGFDPLQGIPSREAVWQRIHPDDLGRLNENIERGVREKRSFANEHRIILPDGTVKHVEATNHPVFSACGELLEIVVTGVDVTERKRAEERLRESEAKFRDYAETASDWFWEIGPDCKITLLTENAFGSRPADRIGTACWDHALDLEKEPDKWRLLWETLGSRKPFRDFVYLGLDGNGSPMHVRVSGKPVFDADGRFLGYRGTGTDVTVLIRAQEEHERLRKLESDIAHMNRLSMMGELAASLAHEIAQPIATARNNARAAMHFLERSPPDLGQVREAQICVVDDADRAGNILDRIRDHIKKAPPRKERVDLNQAVTDVIALAQGAIVKNGISIQTHFTEGLSDIQVDRVQLQQVVLNLILNAVEAMGSIEGGVRELSITTQQHEAGGVLVAVRDSGPGIDPEHLDHIFDAFHTTKSSGVGMGLSICRSIIDAHGGRLWAHANEPRGAVFQFTFPSVENKLMNVPQAAPQNGVPQGGIV